LVLQDLTALESVPTRTIKRAGYTGQQLKDWQAYERVRKGGLFNMYDPQAKEATGLDEGAYSFTQSNFTELKQAIAVLKPIE